MSAASPMYLPSISSAAANAFDETINIAAVVTDSAGVQQGFENNFARHLHRCDFGYFIDFMGTIGSDNRRHVKSIEVMIKDTWSCGRGLLGLLRFYARARPNNIPTLTWSYHEWNLEHADILDPDGGGVDFRRKLHNKYRATQDTCWALNDTVRIYQQLAEEGNTTEREACQALDKLLAGMPGKFECLITKCEDYSLPAVHGFREADARADEDKAVDVLCSVRYGLVDKDRLLVDECSRG